MTILSCRGAKGGHHRPCPLGVEGALWGRAQLALPQVAWAVGRGLQSPSASAGV